MNTKDRKRGKLKPKSDFAKESAVSSGEAEKQRKDSGD